MTNWAPEHVGEKWTWAVVLGVAVGLEEEICDARAEEWREAKHILEALRYLEMCTGRFIP